MLSNDRYVCVGGLGVVGKATMKTFGIKDCFDLKGSTLTLEEIANYKRYVFICVPTPVEGEADVHDISAIRQIIKQIDNYGGSHLYIVRSTTTPGQLKHLAEELDIDTIVHAPEFLTMSTWKQDVEDPDLIVVGALLERYGDEVAALFRARYPNVELIQTTTTTSEMIKTAINSFYAIKVVFANEVYDACTRLDIEYDTVKEAMYKRKWIGQNHLDAVFNGVRGVRGPCLPKDLRAFGNGTGSKLAQLASKLNKAWA